MANATLKRTSMALLVAACCAAVEANPTLPQVVNGQASFMQQGNVFSITNTPGTIIDWQSFSVAPGELTRFIQQSDSSAVLNRILGQDPSQILGALQSNGRVFLINPNGILFGRNARVDVNGLVASTLNISNADFLAGKNNFAAGPVAGAIVNQGAITSAGGGQVFLIAPDIDNSGIITSSGGEVVLAAGRTVQLVDSSSPDLRVLISAPEDRAINLGQIIAQGGKVGIYGALVKQRGLVSADSAQAGANGKIVFKASGDTLLEAGSVTSATGAGSGGQIQVLGTRVGITGDARIDASGVSGGGTVLAGGGYQGKDAQVMNAQQTWFGKDAVIRADARGAGNGGTVVLWGDQATRAFGTISARGGALSGNGGLVETSANFLDVNGITVDASAPHGSYGSWLLDPRDIAVRAAGAAVRTDVDMFSHGSMEGESAIDPGLLNGSADVVLQAKNDITFDAPVAIGAGFSLTAQAGNNIHVNSALSTNGGALKLSANDPSDLTATGTGSVLVNAALDSGNGALDIVGANITFGVGTAGTGRANSGTGAMTLHANSAGGGINLDSGTSLTGSSRIDLIADAVSLAGTIEAGGAGGATIVSFSPATAARPIVIEAEGSAGTLSLTPAELANINAYELNIGNSGVAAPLTVSAGFTPAAGKLRVLVLETSGDIMLNDTIDMAANNADSVLLAGLFGTGQINLAAGAALKANNILLRGDNMAISGAINAHSVTLNAQAASAPIVLGADVIDSAGTLTLDQGELNRITAKDLTIGSASQSGNVKVAGALTVPLDNTEGTASLKLASGTGNIEIVAALSAPGQISLVSNGGEVKAAAPLTSGPVGTVGAERLYAQGGSVDLMGSNSLDMVGGRASSGDFKINAASSLSVQALGPYAGITAAGGIALSSGMSISQGGGAPLTGASLKLAATGNIDLDGDNNVGALAASGFSSLAYWNTGNLTIGVDGQGIAVGTGSTSSGLSVEVGSGGMLSVAQQVNAGGGWLLLAGQSVQIGNTEVTEGTVGVSGQSVGVSAGSGTLSVLSGATITAASDSTGMVALHADKMAIGGAVNGHAAALAPYSAATAIVLGTGATDAEGTLGLDQAEMNRFAVEHVTIGGSAGQSGSVTVSGALNLPLITSDTNHPSLTLNAGSGNVNVLAALSAPGRVALVSEGGMVRASLPDAPGTVGTVGATSLYAQGASVDLRGPNLVGVVAGQASAGDFKFSSVNGISVQEVGRDAPLPPFAGITASGAIVLDSGVGIGQGPSAPLVGASLKLTSPGQIYLSEGANSVGKLAASGFSSLRLYNAGALTIGLDGEGITAGPVMTSAFVDVETEGLLSVTHPVNAGDAPVWLEGHSVQVGNIVATGGGGTLTTPVNVSGNSVWMAATSSADGKVSVLDGATISASSEIGIEANQMAFSSLANLSVPTGSAVLLPWDFEHNIEIGTGALDSSSTLGLSQAELQTIDSASLGIFNASEGTGGSLSVVGTLDLSASPRLTSTHIATDGNLTVGAPLRVPGGLQIRAGAALSLGALVEAGDHLSVYSDNGITGSGVLKSDSVYISSQSGIGSAGAPIDTETAYLSAFNSDSGTGTPINIRNNFAVPGEMTLSHAEQENTANNGDITVLNYGGMTVSGTVIANGGSISLATHSPLTINGTVSSSTGAINLEAGGSGALTIATGALVRSTSGAIALRAGSTITAPAGTVTTTGTVSETPSLGGTVTPPPPPPAPPTVSECLATPSISGCSTILADALTSCIANPAGATCTAVLPTLATCTASPGTLGCSVVLPSLTTCVADPTAAGCSVVLPSLTTCLATPTTSGCSAVLPSLSACLAKPLTSGCAAVLPTFEQCVAQPTLGGCSAVLPTLAACTLAPTTAGCSVVLPTLAACILAPSTAGCTAVLPSAATCTLAPTTAGCTAVLPTLEACTLAPSTTGCAAVLPTLAACTVAPTTAGCSVVLPTLAACTLAPSTSGCSVVLPSLATCSTTPATAGCSVVLPTLASCVANPALTGCSAVLPTLTVCLADPAATGCSVVLPSLASCIANPAATGCGVVLPSLTSCTANPAATGCGVVLPSLTSCIASPTSVGCSAVLPTLAICSASPATAGCSVVLPSLSSCVANPTQAGCSAVLPSLASCIASPASTGCSAVLPTLASCSASPATAGCSVVLPSFDTCVANPAQAGCSAVLPSMSTCIASPATAGCAVVLPTLAACESNPALSGCSAVLPSLASCTANRAQAGCTAVLPSLAQCVLVTSQSGCTAVLPDLDECVTAAATPGCSVVLPSLSSCVANSARTGCSVVLPGLSVCIASPSDFGCSVVLPTLVACTTAPATAGCQVVLPSLSQCTLVPTQAGCSAVLPTLAQCSASPTLQGCTAVVPTADFCTTHPTDPTCVVVKPSTEVKTGTTSPVAVALATTVQLINTSTARTSTAGASTITAGTSTAGTSTAGTSGTGGGAAVAASPAPSTSAGPSAASDSVADAKTDAKVESKDESKSDKKDEKTAEKSETADSTNSGAKNETPKPKTYCN